MNAVGDKKIKNYIDSFKKERARYRFYKNMVDVKFRSHNKIN